MLNNMEDDILNTGPYDPFKDMMNEIHQELNIEQQKITIHVVQRKTRKYITSVEGIEHYGIDLHNFLKTMRKKCGCNGNVSKETNSVNFQGNQKEDLIQVLTQDFNIGRNLIVLRGI